MGSDRQTVRRLYRLYCGLWMMSRIETAWEEQRRGATRMGFVKEQLLSDLSERPVERWQEVGALVSA